MLISPYPYNKAKYHHHDHSQHEDPHGNGGPSRLRLATRTTIHCLLGCGLGEVTGMIIGTALHMAIVPTIVLAVFLGFVFGFALGIIPLLRAGFSYARAFKQVFIAESLNIAVMKTAEVLVQIYTPGVMEAGLAQPIFWIGMVLALIAGFLTAFPVNYIMIGKGVRHIH